MQSLGTSRRLAALAVAALALTASACKDSTGNDDHDEPDVETMRLTIAGQAPLTVSANGTVTGTLSIPMGVATTITAEFLDHDGDVITDLDADEFELSVNAGAGITFARTGAFTGTLTGGVEGTVNVLFGLFHIDEGHNDFGPFAVPITVAAMTVAAQAAMGGR